MFAISFSRKVRSLALITIVIAAAAGCQAGAAGQPASAAGPDADPAAARHAAITALIADAEAARGNRDARAFHQLRVRLAAKLDAATIARTHATYRRVVADLLAAEAQHDVAAQARFKAQLRELCGPGSIAAVLESCPASVSAASR
jgi:hypothetical protein